jgi:hypothetical protein
MTGDGKWHTIPRIQSIAKRSSQKSCGVFINYSHPFVVLMKYGLWFIDLELSHDIIFTARSAIQTAEQTGPLQF